MQFFGWFGQTIPNPAVEDMLDMMQYVAVDVPVYIPVPEDLAPFSFLRSLSDPCPW